MKRLALSLLAIFALTSIYAQWQPQGDKIKTQWAEKVNPTNVLPEYPRPIMERSDWMNLNGLWDYAIRPRGEVRPDAFDGKILVPFAIESSLSGVQKTVGRQNDLWYHTTFTLPKGWKGRHVLLHFGAVDWRCEVYVNGIKIGSHQGGYAAFSFDITPYLEGTRQQIDVRVWDPTDDGFGGIGKQRNKPNGIWYTSVTGIWQTVWLEPVAEKHITQVVATPDIDKRKLVVETRTAGTTEADIVKVTLREGKTVVATGRAAAGQTAELAVKEPKLWSPDSPFLYDMDVELLSAGRSVDVVKSYAAMRKISIGRDKDGIMRMLLNNKPLFQLGPLDQGY